MVAGLPAAEGNAFIRLRSFNAIPDSPKHVTHHHP